MVHISLKQSLMSLRLGSANQGLAPLIPCGGDETGMSTGCRVTWESQHFNIAIYGRAANKPLADEIETIAQEEHQDANLLLAAPPLER